MTRGLTGGRALEDGDASHVDARDGAGLEKPVQSNSNSPTFKYFEM